MLQGSEAPTARSVGTTRRGPASATQAHGWAPDRQSGERQPPGGDGLRCHAPVRVPRSSIEGDAAPRSLRRSRQRHDDRPPLHRHEAAERQAFDNATSTPPRHVPRPKRRLRGTQPGRTRRPTPARPGTRSPGPVRRPTDTVAGAAASSAAAVGSITPGVVATIVRPRATNVVTAATVTHPWPRSCELVARTWSPPRCGAGGPHGSAAGGAGERPGRVEHGVVHGVVAARLGRGGEGGVDERMVER